MFYFIIVIVIISTYYVIHFISNRRETAPASKSLLFCGKYRKKSL